MKPSLPTCTVINTLGLRCSYSPLPDDDKCLFHQSLPLDAPPPKEFTSAQGFAKAVLESYEFRDYIIRNLVNGKLPGAIVIRLMDYADGWGKPVETVKHIGETIVTEVRRVIVHPDSSSSMEPSDSLEMDAGDFDVPMISAPPRRTH